jgi:hypothetical protein
MASAYCCTYFQSRAAGLQGQPGEPQRCLIKVAVIRPCSKPGVLACEWIRDLRAERGVNLIQEQLRRRHEKRGKLKSR